MLPLFFILPIFDFHTTVLPPTSVEQSVFQSNLEDMSHIGSFVHGSIKDYGFNSDSEGNEKDEQPVLVAISHVQRDASLSTVPFHSSRKKNRCRSLPILIKNRLSLISTK